MHRQKGMGNPSFPPLTELLPFLGLLCPAGPLPGGRENPGTALLYSFPNPCSVHTRVPCHSGHVPMGTSFILRQAKVLVHCLHTWPWSPLRPHLTHTQTHLGKKYVLENYTISSASLNFCSWPQRGKLGIHIILLSATIRDKTWGDWNTILAEFYISMFFLPLYLNIQYSYKINH